MLEIDETQFESAVLEASREQPVVLDLWAPWCGPCRALGPLLEQLEQHYDGRFRLVKVNIDSNPTVAARLQVRSIPYVLAFVDGRPVDAFVGALGEAQLREFLDRVLPSPAEYQRRQARVLYQRGAMEDATAALRLAVQLDPSNLQAQLDLAELLLEAASTGVPGVTLVQVEELLARASKLQRGDARFSALQTRLASLSSSGRLPGEAELRRRIETDSSDSEARMALAQRLVAEQRFEAALEQLFEIVRADPKFKDGAARRMMLDVFELAADQSEMVTRYRRRLAALLNR